MVPPGAAVGTLTASSSFGSAGRLQYSITDRRFTISPYTGQLFAGSTLDSGSYVFLVIVADLAAPQSVTTATFTVVVDCASIGYRPCNPPYVETSVSESAPVGTLVMSLQNAGLGLSSSRPYSVPYNNLPPGGTLNSIEFPSYSSPQNLQSYGGPYTSYRRSLRHTGKEEIESRRTKKYRQLSYASLNQMSASAVGTNFLIQKTSGPGVFRVDPNRYDIFPKLLDHFRSLTSG
ncbi:hypothetical protein RvY_04703-2 [Ramazzottius varieornatus]|uniref:Cadherin domain-containing protein n=1 Tax=Ramazzottius varieornatus TaxID=947166 RepID=A0A1D1UY63_RAMVA|nr:hypothetical protein RvY_04703-2 [Ramazzottius varieornatus]